MKKLFATIILTTGLCLSACQLPSFSSSESLEESGSSSSFEYSGEHKDADNDDYCDDCYEPVTVTFDFFAINDLHGKFDDTANQGGVDELSTYLTQAKEKNPNTLLLSSGDMWQGSPEANLTRGGIINDWMNEMGFLSMTLGNHEFDWGEAYIEKNEAEAKFPYLGINIYDSQTNRRVEYCQPSVTVHDEESNITIGIIGAIGDCYSSISGDKSEGVYFQTGKQLTQLVKTEALRLRKEEGVDFIVYSLHGDHQQNGEYDVSLSQYVDLVFEGHTHKGYSTADAYGVYHLQNWGDNGGVSHAEVQINYVTGRSSVVQAETLSSRKYQSLEDHPVVDTLLEKYADEIALATKVLGKNGKIRSEEEICPIVAKLYYEAGKNRWTDKEIVMGGGFLKLRSPYKLNAGDVVYGDLMNILPFDNPLALCSIRGQDLQNKFLSERENYHVYMQEGLNIDSSETYYVVVDSYTAQYRYNGLTVVEWYDQTTFARDLLATYIEGGNLR